MAKFETVIKKARFKVVGFSPTTMARLGRVLLDSITARLDRAQDVYDASAPPLALKYQGFKLRKYGSGVRDLKKTGRTRRGMNVLEAGQNYAVIGFTDTEAAFRVRLNNRLSRQWGVSPANSQAITTAVRQSVERPVVVTQTVGPNE